jgi:hypothetical protein
MSFRVICMVRGGEAGRIVQEQAIQYAQQAKLPLVFLNIIDLSGLPLKNEGQSVPARAELTWLARVHLSQARMRAKSAGLKPETAIRYGPVLETTVGFLQESPTDRLFIGAPHPDDPQYAQRSERVREFASQLTQATGVEVVIASNN